MQETESNILKCEYEQGILHKFFYRQAQNIHKFLIIGSGNYFLKPNDIISHKPTLFGYHEPHLETLFFELTKTHNDFLLDVGANIGMTAVMVGQSFKAIHCVEPNTTITKILDVNVTLAGLRDITTIHEIGLGFEDKVEELHIPKSNFGGAYIANENAYESSNVMTKREEEEKIFQKIQVLESNSWIKNIFAKNPNWKNGVIKIDVEGFELHIFQAILKHIPKNVSVIVIMENFLDRIDFESFDCSSHKIKWFGFYKEKQHIKSILFKLLGMSSYYKQFVSRIDKTKPAPHDLIIHFNPISVS